MMTPPQAPVLQHLLVIDLQMVGHAVSEAERPAAEAALAQAAEQYNRGACSLEAFLMRMVAVSGREAVIDSLHAVGWCSQARLPPSGSPCLHLRELRASVLQVQLLLSCSRGHGADLMSSSIDATM